MSTEERKHGAAEAENLLVAAQNLLAAYRERYGRVQGGIRENAVLRTEFGRLAVAVNECQLHPLDASGPTPDTTR